MRKIIFLICTTIALILIVTFIIPTDASEIFDADVNSKNGDIAFCYRDYDTDLIKVLVFNKDGEKLFSHAFNNSGVASLAFIEGRLFVYLFRAEQMYECDVLKNQVNTSVDSDRLDGKKDFDGWSSSSGEKSFSFGEYVYTYKSPTVFSDKAKLTIKNGDEVKVIYNSQ